MQPEAFFAQQLAELREQGLARSLRKIESAQRPRIQIAGKEMRNFSSNDDLGLANDERLKTAAIEAINRYGVGSGASRLICGSLAPHHELEESLAAFKHCPAALTFSSGYAAAVGTICAVLGKEDIIVIDKRIHASIVDAARLSGATLRVFDHNDLDDLEDILKWGGRTRPTASKSKMLVVTESVFSMDGDHAPLLAIVQLKEKYGAWLMLDEAHATGLYGERGGGRAEELMVTDRIEIHMGTLGKALGSSGGFIAGSRPLVDYLINRARSFIFSTAPVPAVSAAAAAAIRVVQSGEGAQRRQRLWQRAAEVAPVLRFSVRKIPSAILPLIVGEEGKAMAMASALFERGIFVPGIRYPSVPRGEARLRITVTAAHEADDVDTLAKAMAELAESSLISKS
jgi:8-amino-7-oxononanoate synthase